MADEEVNRIVRDYEDMILEDREPTSALARYFLAKGYLRCALKFYENMDDELKDLLADKTLERGVGLLVLQLQILRSYVRGGQTGYTISVDKVVKGLIAKGNRYDAVVEVLLEEIKVCMREEDFKRLVEQIGTRHYLKYRLIQKLSEL